MQEKIMNDQQKEIAMVNATIIPPTLDIIAICSDCGKAITREEGYFEAEGEKWCKSCFSKEFFICGRCGDIERRSDSYTVHTRHGIQQWCNWCMDGDTYTCDDCGEIFASNYYDRFYIENTGEELCEDCYETRRNCGEVFRCEGCGCLYSTEEEHYDDDYSYCNDCYERVVSRNIIHDYHSYPDSWDIDFTRYTSEDDRDRCKQLFMGVELEVDRGGENPDNARAIISKLGNYNEDVLAMHDGSLSNGFEIITQPATLNYHILQYGMDDAMQEAIDRGYKSHDAGTCGLHVHIDRDYFDDCFENPEKAISAIVTNNQKWLIEFSRRDCWDYCEFADTDHVFDYDRVKGDIVAQRHEDAWLEDIVECYSGHGSALNFDGNTTIEIRFNRGTLKFDTYVATLQFVQMLADFAKLRLDVACRVRKEDFMRVAEENNYEEFIEYMQGRKLA